MFYAINEKVHVKQFKKTYCQNKLENEKPILLGFGICESCFKILKQQDKH